MNKPRQYLRFVLSDRIQHFVLMVSFTVLALTGLPQKYADWGISVAFIRLLGGIEITRVIHHTAAVTLIIVSIYHVVVIGYRIFVQRTGLAMLPELKDVTDFLQAVRYNLGLTDEHPHYGRYNFIEKLEYWAVVWGTVLMTITGYVLWNPVLVTRYLPGEVIPTAKMAHGLEALLAVLSIITWHSYFVHLAKFNKSIFTGHMDETEMQEEHGQELEQRLKGEVRQPPSPEVRWRRLRIYTPLATLFVLISILGTYRFLTVERTAITTVPRIAAEEKVYQPVPLEQLPTVQEREPRPTPPRTLPKPQVVVMPVVSHGVGEDMAQCNMCHDVNSLILPAPTDHRGRSESECLTCHEVQGGEQ